jgi:hypothetical protein
LPAEFANARPPYPREGSSCPGHVDDKPQPACRQRRPPGCSISEAGAGRAHDDLREAPAESVRRLYAALRIVSYCGPGRSAASRTPRVGASEKFSKTKKFSNNFLICVTQFTLLSAKHGKAVHRCPPAAASGVASTPLGPHRSIDQREFARHDKYRTSCSGNWYDRCLIEIFIILCVPNKSSFTKN